MLFELVGTDVPRGYKRVVARYINRYPPIDEHSSNERLTRSLPTGLAISLGTTRRVRACDHRENASVSRAELSRVGSVALGIACELLKVVEAACGKYSSLDRSSSLFLRLFTALLYGRCISVRVCIARVSFDLSRSFSLSSFVLVRLSVSVSLSRRFVSPSSRSLLSVRRSRRESSSFSVAPQEQ